MSRLREFDRNEVVTKALDLFWSDGYNASSISKLIAVMGINRSSLYATFGNKDNLFSEAMACYARSREGLHSSTLIGIEDPIQAIRSFYYSKFINEDVSLSNGCLLFNTVSELSNTSPEIASEAGEYLREVRELFVNRLIEARDKGMIDEKKDIDAQADYLLAMISGLRSLSKMGSDRSALKKVIDTTLDSLVL